jgi:hypothetical protein
MSRREFIARREDNRNCRSRCFSGARRDGAACGGQYGHAPTDEFRHQRWQSIDLIKSIAIFDRNVLTLDIAGFRKTPAKRCHEVRRILRCRNPDEPDHRHRRLLRAHRERPDSRAAEKGDELAPPHSMTSSASASSVGATAMPSSLAVCRLITNSKVVGCVTGRSAGFSPLRMRPV